MLSFRSGCEQANVPVNGSARQLIAYSGAMLTENNSYRLSDAIWFSVLRNPKQHWRRLPISTREVVFGPHRTDPSVSIRELVGGMNVPPGSISLENSLLHLQEKVLSADVVTPDGVPLGGKVELILRGDGSYTFRGYMRATGFTSYEYMLQVFLECKSDVVILLQHSGRVYGTDTPGPQQREWNESGVNRLIRLFWPEIRSAGGLRYQLDADMAGVLATIGDVLVFGLKAYLAFQTGGATRFFIFAGSELATRASDSTTENTGWLNGLTVIGTTLVLLGHGFALPVFIAGLGIGVAMAAAIKSRRMNGEEIRFAQRVFGNSLPYRRIILTNMSGFGGRKFVYPALDGSILLNLGDAFEDPGPLRYERKNLAYWQPGTTFIHELTHAWQIAQDPVRRFLPLWICEGATAENYHYFRGSKEISASATSPHEATALKNLSAARLNDKEWPKRPWRNYNIEEQASIVDDWFGEHDMTGLDMPAALNDPAFRFISGNIRTGRD